MSIDDPLPPRRMPDWPQQITAEDTAPIDASLDHTRSYPQSIDDYANVMTVGTPLTTPTSTYATVALIAGLATLVTFGVTGILAVIFGHFAIPETKTGQRSGHGMAVTGLIFGYLALIGWIGLLISLISRLIAGTDS